jgi:hypothetical protein
MSLRGVSILTAEAVVREVEKENARKRELSKQQSCWTKFKEWFPLTKPRIVLNPTQQD